jgi:hypothetical protein
MDFGSASFVRRLLRRKKWVYVAVVSEELWISLAIVRTGYATSTFVAVFDLGSSRMLAERAVVGPPRSAEVADDPHATGVLARFGSGRTRALLQLRGDVMELSARVGDVTLEAELDARSAPPAISAIAALPGEAGLVSATEKRALAAVRGSVVVGGRRCGLDRAIGGYDYTQGLLPRRTRWRWAFATGRASDGTAVAFNVVDGFVGEPECAAFEPSGVRPLYTPRIVFDKEHPERTWTLDAQGMALTFEPGAIHAQNTNLLLVRSRFLQPVGRFFGTLQVGDRSVELNGVPGVVEDQDVVW